MGISGLLPFLKNACRPVNIRDFSGATVAIDAYSWLHKGAFSCAEKLVKGEYTDGYVHYCLKMLNLLTDAGVKPIMVFDGCNLPSKAITEKKRRENRERTKLKGKELLCQGKLREARECFQRCVDVTPEMAYEVIQACKKKGIDCVVAPYEADAQLAYLSKSGIAQIVITEDSDLTLFGCEKILFKMDSCGGGFLYEKTHLPKCFSGNAEKFSFEKFRYMCILSGCDYLPSLPGIGLAKACKFFTLTTNTDLQSVLSKLPSYLKMPRLIVTDEYKEAFIQANNTFLYQLVFCPLEKKLVPLNAYPSDVDSSDMEYAGKYLPHDIALQLALGNVNVKTMKNFEGTTSQQKSDSKKQKSGDESMWNFDSVSDTTKPIETKPKNVSFKFRTVPKIKSDAACRKAVELTDKSKIQEAPFRDDDLMLTYLSPANKKQKISDELTSPDDSAAVDDVVPEKPKSIRYSPFRKPLMLNGTNSGKAASNTTPEVVVRSRFFHKPEQSESGRKETASVQGSWLESIDKEYALDSAKPVLMYPGRTVDILSEKLTSTKSEKNDEISTSTPCLFPIVKTGKENTSSRVNKLKSTGFRWSSSPKLSADGKGSLSSENNSFNDSYDSEDNQSSIVSTSSSMDTVPADSNYFSSSPVQDSPVTSSSDHLVTENSLVENIVNSDLCSPNACTEKDRIRDKFQVFRKNPKEVTQAPKSSSEISMTRKLGRVGLSKKFRTKSAKRDGASEKNVNIKETLLNFMFVKKDQSMRVLIPVKGLGATSCLIPALVWMTFPNRQSKNNVAVV